MSLFCQLFQPTALKAAFPATPDTDANNITIIEEIKTTTRAEYLAATLKENQEHEYILQKKMYAWLCALKNNVPCRCRLRIVSMLNESELVIDCNATHELFGYSRCGHDMLLLFSDFFTQ